MWKYTWNSPIPAPCQGSTATSCSISLVHLKVSKAPGQVHMVHDHGWPWIHGQRVDTRPGKRSHITMEKITMLLIEQSPISMGHGFNSYVKLPEGTLILETSWKQKGTCLGAISADDKVLLDVPHGGFHQWGYPNSWIVYHGQDLQNGR